MKKFTNKIKEKVILTSIVMLSLSSCSPSSDPLRKFFGSYRNYVNINGKIKDGRYYEPYGRFSIKVPSLMTPGMITDGNFIESGGTIAFRDDFGALVRIDLITANDSESKKFLNSENQKLILEKLRNNFLNLYKETVPNSKIIYQEYIVWNNKSADSFAVDMKGGGTLIDGDGKRGNSLRTSISFIHNNLFYLISTQPSMLVQSGNNLKDIKKRVEYTKNILDTMILN